MTRETEPAERHPIPRVGSAPDKGSKQSFAAGNNLGSHIGSLHAVLFDFPDFSHEVVEPSWQNKLCYCCEVADICGTAYGRLNGDRIILLNSLRLQRHILRCKENCVETPQNPRPSKT